MKFGIHKFMVTTSVLFFLFSFIQFTAAQEIGIGIVSPNLIPKTTLYFYNKPDFRTVQQENIPIDSLTFFESEFYIDIKTAPPWFVPEYAKLDYNILALRAVTLTKNWIEVIVNNQNQQTAWVKREDVQFNFWEDFLLNVFSVEVLDLKKNPVRIKPLNNASTNVKFQSTILIPIAIQDEWMMVFSGDPLDKNIMGWIKWRDKDRLLISYSMLN